MASAREKLARAAEQADDEGYYRDDDGRFVDPEPVQKVAIEVAFRSAADEPGFDIWTIVNWQSAYRDGDTLAENFQRVHDQWSETVENPELKERVAELIEEHEQGGEEE